MRIKVEPPDVPTDTGVQRILEKDDQVPGAEAVEVDRIDVDDAVQEATVAQGARVASAGARALDKEAASDLEVLTEDEDATDEEAAFDISTDENESSDQELETGEADPEDEENYRLANRQPEWKNIFEEYASLKDSQPAQLRGRHPPIESTFKGNSEESKASRYHKTYLVQLPPLVPSLRDTLTKPTVIKKEKRPKSEQASTDPFSVPHPKAVTKEETTPPPPPTIVDHQEISNAIHQPAHASDFTSGIAGTLTFYENGKTIASWGDLTFEVTKEKEALGLAQETMIMDYEKVITRNEDRGKWEEIVTVGGRGAEGQKEQEDIRKVGYSGGRVGGGFCMLGA